MSKDAFSISLKAKLENLFATYEQALKLPEQLTIINNGFAFSNIDPAAEILVMGINPSLRNDFIGPDGYSYDYETLESDRYFKKFFLLLKDFESHGITYCDLFYHRHTEQKQIEHFLKDDLGRAFLGEQLDITREVIHHVSPKLILLFNRKGAEFFTKDWIGLTIKKFNSPSSTAAIPDLYTIDNTDSLIYCSAFLGYRTSKHRYAILHKDLPLLYTMLEDF